MKLIQISNFRDFAKCPAYCKFNFNKEAKSKKHISDLIIEEMLSKLSDRAGKLSWEQIRNRITNSGLSYEDSITLLDSTREFYLKKYRDIPSEYISNIKLETTIFDQKIEAFINGIFVNSKNEKTLVEVSDCKNIESLNRDICLRIKLFILKQNHLEIDKILIISPETKKINYWEVRSIYNYKIEDTIKLYTHCIKNNLFPPSPTQMCNTCNYKEMCTW